MPSTIPYDPSLVLGNIVSNHALDYVTKVSGAQATVDAAQNVLNSFLSTKRSLEMTRTELLNLKISTEAIEAIDKESANLDKQIADQAAAYATAKMQAGKTMLNATKEKSDTVNIEVESPVDYVKTEIKTMPLAADSVSMDVQYFSNDTNEEDSATLANNVAAFVGASLSNLGTTNTAKMTAAASNQVNAQTSKHKISGTLVLSVSCTHKNASILAPFVLNVDKGIKAWNSLFKEEKDQLDPTDDAKMRKVVSEDEGTDSYSIVSGMTFGSSFVGMVHVLNTEKTSAAEAMSSMASSLQAQMDAGSWFENASGGFGVNESFANDVKNLLSTQNITSHVTMLCMGAIPSMVANNVKIGVQEFATFDPAKNMAALATLQNATNSDQDAVKSAAEAARTGKQMVTMRAGDVKSALSALGNIDDGANKILDINSMMTAFDDYLKKASDGKSGIPINYYLKNITKKYLAEMWVAKYYPGKYIQIHGDDSKNTTAKPGTVDPPNGGAK